jgi:glycosyltransferase involved in cell wall biosynthesis
MTFEEMLEPLCADIFIIRTMRWHKPIRNIWYKRIVNYIYNAFLSGWHILPVFKLFFIIKKLDINIVHTNSIMSIDPSIAAKIAGIPHIWHIREAIGNHQDAIVRFPLQRFPGIFSFFMDKLSDRVIVNSNFTLSHAQKSFPHRKLEVIYNSLPDDWFVQKEYKSDKSEFVVGTIANVTAQMKNHKLVIEVAAILKHRYPEINVTFQIYGNLPADNSPYYLGLKKKIDHLYVGGIVKFMGRIPVESIYSEIDILFHPFGKEGFGRIYIEAMGKGIPVVALEGGGADELIEDGVTGYKVNAFQPETVADKIVELITNSASYQTISNNGFEYASSQFRSSRMWEQIEKCYQFEKDE